MYFDYKARYELSDSQVVDKEIMQCSNVNRIIRSNKMSTKPMKPIKPPKKEIHFEDTESINCDDCGNYSFIKSYFIRRISPIVSPTGQEQ